MRHQVRPRRRLIGPGAGALGSRWLLSFGAALCLATLTLLWLGYRATNEWQRSERQLAERRASEKLALLVAALDRDMKGAQLSVLVPINQEHLNGGTAGLATMFARAFARFPYPESFFVWASPEPAREVRYVFNRSDRPPPWDRTAPETAARYPVITRRDRTALDPLIDRIRDDATHRRRFAAEELVIDGVPYQLVVHLLYDGVGGAARLRGLVGFTVNLPWIKRTYFEDLAQQVSRIGGDSDEMAVTISGETGEAVAPHGQLFPVRFFDRNLTQWLPEDRQPEQWTARVAPLPDLAEPGMLSGQRMFALMALAALASIVGFAVIARGLVIRSELIAMQSEFVSTVTHELKTPLSLMRLVADALVTGRYKGQEKITEYGDLLSTEVTRMGRLIDNLLSFARVKRVSEFYTAAPLDVAELFEEAAASCRSRLDQLGIALTIEMGAESIVLHADRTALLLVMDNLLDNAIRHSTDAATRAIAVRARRQESEVVIEVEDKGTGIAAADLPHVLDKFYRGKNARAGGSGLGLAIVDQIVRDHLGRVGVASSEGAGTTVSLWFPA